ncbi:MAG TPA: SAM-dependent methyltransferase [Terriglobales bacterium]|nr:SAM-dependent methyltransferase [Terriglobales bacterium]
MTLREKIVQEIRELGPIPFSRYMELCLYDPELGYYSRSAEQFGKAGDFYTSSDVHAVFGRLMARQFEEMWRALGSPKQIEILELGPGRGLFAQDVLDWSEKKFPEFFSALRYLLAEQSPALQKRLREILSQQFAADKVSLASFFAEIDPAAAEQAERAPQGRMNPGSEAPVIIFANEFFDALPVEVLSRHGELRIAEKDGRFVETWAPASAGEQSFLDRHSVHPEEERIEAPLTAQRCMAEAAASIQRGFLIAIDYGYTRDQLLAGRHRGTVMAYRQHSVGTNPYEAPGEQDITAHVNFTALAAAAEQQRMHVQPLLTQSQFLMGIGERNQFADAFEECRLPQERAKVALQLKHLVTPAGMGETFHVLVASKGIAPDAVSCLSGLRFGKSHL